jgi:hypothetical protein
VIFRKPGPSDVLGGAREGDLQNARRQLRVRIQRYWERNVKLQEPHEGRISLLTSKSRTRTVRDASMPLNGPNSPDVATGKVYRSTVLLRVQWMWLSLPVAVWVISLIVWMGTIWKSRKASAPLRRDNALPLLFILPRDKETTWAAEGKLGSSSTGYTMGAEHMNVKLVKSAGRFKLVNR